MSNKTYNELLIETSELIGEATQADEALFEAGEADRTTLLPLLLELRVRYTVLLARLDAVYDQLLQPQKRMIVKRLLESCLGRLIEIKHDLVEMRLSDHTFDDDEALVKLQVTPHETEPCIPQFFILERAEEIESRRQFVLDTLRKLGYEPPKPQPLVLTEQQAVIIIQSHERARQGRLRGQFMKEIRLLKEKGRDQKGEMSAAAATAIQKVWRGFLARRLTKRRKHEEQLLIGMVLPPYTESQSKKRVEEVKDYRRKLQLEREKEYQTALISIEEQLRAQHGMRINEQIGDELRRWIREYYDRTGRFPEIPPEESGGSRAMYSRTGEATQADEALFEAGEADRTTLLPLLLELRVRYTVLLARLDAVYDQLLQPQKRMIVKRLLESCLGRLIEIKHDLVEMRLSDHTFDDDEALVKLQVTPHETEPCIPQFFILERAEEIESRRQFVLDTLRKLGYEPPKPQPLVLTEQQAVIIIQSHERARQGRLRGQFMKEIRLLKEKGRDQKGEMSAAAATAIQKVWRGFLARRLTKRRKHEEQLLIGMVLPPYTESQSKKRVEEVKDYRRKLQLEREKEYQTALISIEEQLRAQHGMRINEQIGDELRRWIREYYDRTGRFPEIPPEESGGSRAMYSRTGTGMDSEISKSSPVSSKESKRSKESKDKKNNKGEENNKNKEEPDDLNVYKCAPSAFLKDMVGANEEYEDIWKFKDDIDNPHERYYKDMIEREKMVKIEQEIRNIVDEMMRNELELLQAAFDRDRAQKGKKSKKQQKKVRRGGKKNKKKKEKDLTPDRTTESLFEELVANGIIRPYPLVNIDDFVGEKCYIGSPSAENGVEAMPCLGDIRQLVKEYCILPMGSEFVRNHAPLVRSVLITGAAACGKKMLVHAICTEVGAMLFDLTPANIVGKYPGKSGLIMLIHLVMKVSRLLQPSVIWMDDAEKPFVKKIPKTDKTDPKRLKKDLVKIIKGICPEDRVLFVGTTKAPWDAEQKLLFQCYQKIIQVPRADYGSISMLWRTRLHKAGALNPRLEISCLSRVSDSYTIGTLLAALDAVLTTKRQLQLRVRALTSAEVAVKLSYWEPVYAEQEAAAESWWYKTPMEKRRQKVMQRLEEMQAEAENGG